MHPLILAAWYSPDKVKSTLPQPQFYLGKEGLIKEGPLTFQKGDYIPDYVTLV